MAESRCVLRRAGYEVAPSLSCCRNRTPRAHAGAHLGGTSSEPARSLSPRSCSSGCPQRSPPSLWSRQWPGYGKPHSARFRHGRRRKHVCWVGKNAPPRCCRLVPIAGIQCRRPVAGITKTGRSAASKAAREGRRKNHEIRRSVTGSVAAAEGRIRSGPLAAYSRLPDPSIRAL